MRNTSTYRRRAVSLLASACVLAGAGLVSFVGAQSAPAELSGAELRAAYAKSPDQWPAATVDPGVKHVELGLLPDVQHPADNPYSKEKAELGRRLFLEPKLSGSGQFACVSCHNPELGWTDGITHSFGHDRQENKRNSMPTMNAGHRTHMFWDGRAKTLEEQALMPITADNEMRGDPGVILDRLKAVPEYVESFRKVFGTKDDDGEISMERVAMALATFQRTIVGGRSKFDQFLKGKHDALNDQQLRGLHLFRTKARCINCHNGPNFTDELFHNNGLHGYGRKHQDLGRYEVTKDPKDVGAFATPSLRNLERTGPYMHHGLFEIDAVLTMYNAGGFKVRPTEKQKDDPLFPKSVDPLLKPLNLSKDELADLQAFLFTLTEPKQRLRADD